MIGDIHGTEKGTGARYNAGKAPLHLIPLGVLGDFFAYGAAFAEVPDPAKALRLLGHFQATHDVAYLYQAMAALGDSWADCAHVFAYGAGKYSEWNWARGQVWTVPLSCAARHLSAMCRGEPLDGESKWPHRGHAYCNLVMLLTFVKTYPEGNDLPKKGLLA